MVENIYYAENPYAEKTNSTYATAQAQKDKEKAKQESGQATRPTEMAPLASTGLLDNFKDSIATTTTTYNPTQSKPTRRAWALTCDTWLAGDYKNMIYFNANPESVSWAMPLRANVVNQRMGKVIHIWRNKIRNTYFDEPKLNITFQSGNILTVINNINTGEPLVISEGLTNFYKFIELLDEPKILPNGKLNVTYLTYRSLMFPEIMLKGFFDPQSFSFVDNTGNQAKVDNWSASFIVMDTFPRMKAANIKVMLDTVLTPNINFD